jgi:hypothetical protein
MRRDRCHLGALALLLILPAPTRAQEPAASAPGPVARAKLRDGREFAGRLEGSASADFRVRAESGPPVPLDEVEALAFEPSKIDPAQASPPFLARLGPSGQVSGRLERLGERELRLRVGPDATPLVVRRDGLRALVQRPGEAQVLRDDFEALDDARWAVRVGEPSVSDGRALVGEKSLVLPSGGSAITARLDEPVGTGRLDVAYYDDGLTVEDQRWFVDLTFRSKEGDSATIRAVPGWTDETIAVESPGGPGLAVQRLLRREGWHRLSVRFDPESTELAIDGDELAHGRGPGGSLVEVRLATEALGDARPDPDLAARLDDLGLARFVQPSGNLEVEPSADEVRFSSGDQLFGLVPSAGPESVTILLEPGAPAQEIPWSRVSGLYLRRRAAQADPVEGPIVRVWWRTGPGDDPRDLDSAEGALKAASDGALELDVPFVGTLSVPMARLARVEPQGRARRLVIDPSAHHLGDARPRKEPVFDPPQAETGPLEIPFDLEAVPPGPARLALDVAEVAGVSGNPEFSEAVRAGRYRTHLAVNGRALDDLNTAVTTPNRSPERVFVAIPPGALKPGRNVVRVEQDADDPERDNLELLGVAVEWPIDASPRTDQP